MRKGEIKQTKTANVMAIFQSLIKKEVLHLLRDFRTITVVLVMPVVLLLLFGVVRNDSRVLVIIRGARRSEMKIEALVFQAFARKARLRVKNTTQDSIELIYEISEKCLNDARKKNPALSDAFYAIEAVEYVNFVMQNDEISN